MRVDPAFVAASPVPVLAALALVVPVKGLTTVLLARVFAQPPRVAFLTGVGLVQSGEFSFLLASMGAGLGVVGQDAFGAMLRTTVASIVLAPALHEAARPALRWLEPRLPEPALARVPSPDGAAAPLRGHAVRLGYGRVGRVIGEALRRRGLRFAVVDQDPRVVRRLRREGVLALLGNAGNPVLLERLGLDRARVLVVAIPDPLAARQAVDHARQHHPRLDIVVRTHSAGDRAYMRAKGVGEAVFAEVERAVELARRTLHRFGVSGAELQFAVQGIRDRAGGDNPEAG
jgi:CPA2 family monovalent cation:H+ antiporter-2